MSRDLPLWFCLNGEERDHILEKNLCTKLCPEIHHFVKFFSNASIIHSGLWFSSGVKKRDPERPNFVQIFHIHNLCYEIINKTGLLICANRHTHLNNNASSRRKTEHKAFLSKTPRLGACALCTKHSDCTRERAPMKTAAQVAKLGLKENMTIGEIANDRES